MDWVSTSEGYNGKGIEKSMASQDCIDLRVVLAAISRGNPGRAAGAIIRLLADKSNLSVKVAAMESLSPLREHEIMNQLIVDGIKGIISQHHTHFRKGTRTIASETFVKNVVVATLFGVVKEEKNFSNHALSLFIGVSFR